MAEADPAAIAWRRDPRLVPHTSATFSRRHAGPTHSECHGGSAHRQTAANAFRSLSGRAAHILETVSAGGVVAGPPSGDGRPLPRSWSVTRARTPSRLTARGGPEGAPFKKKTACCNENDSRKLGRSTAPEHRRRLVHVRGACDTGAVNTRQLKVTPTPPPRPTAVPDMARRLVALIVKQSASVRCSADRMSQSGGRHATSHPGRRLPCPRICRVATQRRLHTLGVTEVTEVPVCARLPRAA